MNSDTATKVRFKSIDGLKTIGAIIIVVHHYYCHIANYTDKVPFYGVLGYLYKNGNFCVELFFIVSGFCMALQYKDLKITFKEFIKKRIIPLWVEVCIANFVSLGILLLCRFCLDSSYKEYYSICVSDMLSNVFMVNNGWVIDARQNPFCSSAWFVCVLFLCYIIFYFINCFSKNHYDLYLFLCVVMIIVGCIIIYKNISLPFLYFCNGRGYISFFGGVVLYELYRNSFKLCKAISVLSLLACSVILLYCITAGNDFILGRKYFTYVLFIIPSIVLGGGDIKTNSGYIVGFSIDKV